MRFPRIRLSALLTVITIVPAVLLASFLLVFGVAELVSPDVPDRALARNTLNCTAIILTELADAWATLGAALALLLDPGANRYDLGRWQVNLIYRSPVHNEHTPDSDDKSWHLYSCAADLQVFPVRTVTKPDGTKDFANDEERQAAEDFHAYLIDLAETLGFLTETREASGIGHVHVYRPCR
ncbi:MAG: hypothetical protein JSW71_10930 [Gemmatimonadota bacterium]|nr:MAG: hypothetical protein JSW71_10930 [Gemmatimonadota bacterium]